MSHHSVYFEGSGGGMMLTQAILLYRFEGAQNQFSHGMGRAMSPAFASIHAIERDDEDRPTLSAGKPFSRAQLRQWTQALGRSTRPEILPDNILVSHPDMLAWWTPAQVRPACFALSSPQQGLKALASRTVLCVPYPPHLFIATRSGLGVYALPHSRRPVAETPVLHSPILNIFLDGKLCWGNIAKPKTLTVASIADYERAVFDSWSTHPNPGQESTVTSKGGLVRLWDGLAARRAKRFPVHRLKPFLSGAGHGQRQINGDPMTVGGLIARGGA